MYLSGRKLAVSEQFVTPDHKFKSLLTQKKKGPKERQGQKHPSRVERY